MSAAELVARAGTAARDAHRSLETALPEAVAAALVSIARRLMEAGGPVLDANAADLAEAAAMAPALRDRLRLDEDRLRSIAAQLEALAALPDPPSHVGSRALAGGLEVHEVRRPVGVIGANYEARPNVTVDVASQLLKSRNAGVLRTGAAALRSALALHEHAIRPGLADGGIDPDVVQVLPTPDRDAARALVSHPRLIPLVILRGSGETTAALAREAAAHGVRTLAHAEGGGVLYVHAAADPERARELVAAGLDRLGVCNRLNLLLIDAARWEGWSAAFAEQLEGLGIRASLPPHPHPLGHEWALDDGAEATVTIAPAGSPEEAAAIADRETSGLAAGICTEDGEAAAAFLSAYRGTGAFWNATTRLLDGFKLLGAPETGINVDHVPGPRGPVTFGDLRLRQYVTVPVGKPVPFAG